MISEPVGHHACSETRQTCLSYVHWAVVGCVSYQVKQCLCLYLFSLCFFCVACSVGCKPRPYMENIMQITYVHKNLYSTVHRQDTTLLATGGSVHMWDGHHAIAHLYGRLMMMIILWWICAIPHRVFGIQLVLRETAVAGVNLVALWTTPTLECSVVHGLMSLRPKWVCLHNPFP